MKKKFTNPDEDRAFWLRVVHNPTRQRLALSWYTYFLYVFSSAFQSWFTVTNLYKYLTYPEVMLDVVDYLRMEIARLDKVSDESIINIGWNWGLVQWEWSSKKV